MAGRLGILQKAISNLACRGYGERDRLMRKMVEEMGEYAEAIEYKNGATRKVAKFKDSATPDEKLREESVDILMIAFAIAGAEGMGVLEACDAVAAKLKDREEGR